MAGSAVTQYHLNLRTEANTTAAVIEVLPQNTTLTILDNLGAWLHVQAPDGNTGYVSAAFVTINTAPPVIINPPPAGGGSQVIVAAPPGGSMLNVRSAPQPINNPDNRIEQVPAGTVLTPLESATVVAAKIGTTQAQNQWLQVQIPDGKTGYVAAWYVQYGSATPVIINPPPIFTQPTHNPLSADLLSYLAEIATDPTTPPIPASYGAFQALANRIGLPDPFDMLPTLQTQDSIRNSLLINGFGPNTFALNNWPGNYSQTDGMHPGLDHMVPSGTALLAVSDGIIVGTERDWKFLASADPCIILWPFLPPSVVDAQNRRMLSNVLVAYGHLSDNTLVKRHQVVNAGDTIGLSGAPGGHTGTNDHLHLEVHFLSGDNNLPIHTSDHPLANYSPAQPFSHISPVNPLLFFSKRMIQLHLRVGRKIINGGPQYPDQSLLDQHGLQGWGSIAPLDFFTVGQYQFGNNLIIWNQKSLPWPNGIYDVPTLVQRASGYTPFPPYPTDFLSR